MLCSLNIRDLAVVQTLDLNLRQGMTALTGETGAGKSILLTALGLALGDRADSGFIRPGSNRAEINLEFDIRDAALARQWLDENDLLEEDDANTCLVRRVLNQDGRSKAYINNRPVTLQALQGLAETLVEIHGQHAHLKLLHDAEQRRLLDESAGNQSLLDEVNALFRAWRQTRQELEALRTASKDRRAQEELLRYQIEELEELDLEAFDFQALVDEHALQANLGNILTTGRTYLEMLYEDERQSVDGLLGQASHALGELCQFAPEFERITELLNEAQIQVEEASRQLRRRLDSLEADPQKLESLDRQLGLIHALSRKHQVAPEELPRHAARLREELNGIEHSAERIESLATTLEQLAADYRLKAEQLSRLRKACAEKLQQRISGMIQELGMPQGVFRINVESATDGIPRADGNDQIEFMVSANPGLPPRPLGKVASGGELSRLSLAIQVATSHSKTTPTMIFDEVDSGIGGGVAEIVGKRLRALGENRQVMCVTHLPQVAAQSHHHLLVEKNSQRDVTQSHVKTLSKQERTHEIARMLGGVTITGQTLAHAEEMLLTGAGSDD
ncbi:MAG: DNA repair protein RecN [Pseudomonadota bacterium]